MNMTLTVKSATGNLWLESGHGSSNANVCPEQQKDPSYMRVMFGRPADCHKHCQTPAAEHLAVPT